MEIFLFYLLKAIFNISVNLLNYFWFAFIAIQYLQYFIVLFNHYQAPFEAESFVQSLSFCLSHLDIEKLKECNFN